MRLAAKKHKSRIMHLFDIRYMGIITLTPTEEEKITLTQFINRMTENGSKVKNIEMPPNMEQQLDKQGIPKTEFTKALTHNHFDLLINATPTDYFYGLYFTLAASSSLRVAYQDTTQPTQNITLNTYDLIIRGNGPMVLSEYLLNLLNVLTNIRKTPTGTY